jgi:hypothetical protein
MKGNIPRDLNMGLVWAWQLDFDVTRVAFFCFRIILDKVLLHVQLITFGQYIM